MGVEYEMIVDITNEVLSRLKTELSNGTVLTSYPSTTPDFPCVIVEELNNNSYDGSKDSSGNHHSDISIEINIFTTGMKRMTDAKTVRNSIDAILSDEYGMKRDYSRPTPNMDTNIYRYVMRYSAIVDTNKTIYGR